MQSLLLNYMKELFGNNVQTISTQQNCKCQNLAVEDTNGRSLEKNSIELFAAHLQKMLQSKKSTSSPPKELQ